MQLRFNKRLMTYMVLLLVVPGGLCGGSGATKHQTEATKELKDSGYRVVVAPDSDEAGLKMLKKFHKAESITHYAFTGDSGQDWNDAVKEMGHEDFAKFFMSKVKNV